MLTDAQLSDLMLHVHASIEEDASAAAAALTPAGHLTEPAYPPNGGYTEDEAAALRGLAATPALESGLRKLVADAVASTVFSLFNVLDGTGDPATADDWPPFEVVPVDEDSDPAQMLHDAFFETYWTWRERRPDPGWTLDTWAP